MDNKLILNSIRNEFGFKTDGEFAEFLGMKPNSYSTWKKRGTIDYAIIMAKCTNINGHFLLTGEGSITIDQNIGAAYHSQISSLELKADQVRKHLDKAAEIQKQVVEEIRLLKNNDSNVPVDTNSQEKV